MPVSLRKLVDATLAKPRITVEDARAVLRAVEKDSRFTAAEVKQLERLTALPGRRFENRDEFIPNPMLYGDGVTVRAEPKKWLEGTVKLATARLAVRSTVPEVSLSLGAPKEYSWDDLEDFGTHWARRLSVSVTGKTASRDGVIDFTYADREVRVAVKAGERLDRVVDRLERALLREEGGTLQTEGRIDRNQSGRRTVRFEVL